MEICAQHRLPKIQADVEVLSKPNLINFKPKMTLKNHRMPVLRKASFR
jgi:hypothetical protein